MKITCMGGWCEKRDVCEFYRPGEVGILFERLCERDNDAFQWASGLVKAGIYRRLVFHTPETARAATSSVQTPVASIFNGYNGSGTVNS